MSEVLSTEKKSVNRDFDWVTVLYYIHLHALGLYGLWLLLVEAKWMTVFFTIFIISISGFGLTVGAHRFWSHRAFEASRSLKFFLMIGQTLAGVGNIYDWVLNHRTHHKYFGTDRDPYNHKKGFLYSYVFSHLLTNHPNKAKLDKDIDMRDLETDIVIWFQRWFYWIIFPIIGLLLPINAPAEYWNETITNSVFILGFLRLTITTHISWLINSAIIIWGLKPGDKYPPDDSTIFVINKSYWPNYHYMLPWDWKTGEFGSYDCGLTTLFIKTFENIGLIESLKTASSESIRNMLYELSSNKKITITDALDNVKKIADEEAAKVKLCFQH